MIGLDYRGAAEAVAGPGVMEAITAADVVVIAPSNPPLSIWPILAIPGIRDAVAAAPVIAVSPLFAGSALKGPAAEVMESLGLAPGNAGVMEAYPGLLDALVVDTGDAADVASLARPDVRVVAMDTRVTDDVSRARFGGSIAELLDELAARRRVR